MLDAEHLTGSLIAGRYRIERKLGEGAAAVVFLAHDERHGRDVALKILRPEVAVALGGARFEREISLSARLSHPHIVPMLDAGETDYPGAQNGAKVLYYVMPVLQGASLRDRLDQQGQLSFDETLQITRDVGLALDYAHAEGVIHRDIKPENVLIGGGTAVVADFGVAKVVSDGSSSNSLTRTGFALGTVLYMSPEQSTAGPVDSRSDIYALGCMVYEMLAGEPPFTGPNPQSILAKHFTDPVPLVRRLRPNLPPGIDEAIAMAMAKTPADRFATAGEFTAALERTRTANMTSLGTPALAPQAPAPAPTPAPPTTPAGGRGRGVAIALGALGIVALGVAMLMLRVRSGQAPLKPSADSVRAIAVLPFDDVSPAKDQEYFATGMADELVTALARLPNLRVAARTSSFALRNTTLSPAEIGRRLRVSALLTGSIAKDGNRLRIRTELVDVNADSVLWRQSFDKEMKDVFVVQEQIAQTVVSQLRVLGTSGKPLVSIATNDTAAYALYLRGRLAWNERTAGSLRQAVTYFRQAIAKDSNYARAWAGLADTYNVIGLNFYGHPGDNFQLGREAALQAIALDSTLAEAHAALASATAFLARDWKAAEASYKTAIQLDPTYPTTYYFYSIFLLNLRRNEEGIANAKRAHELDPSSSALAQGVGMAYLNSGRFAEALEPFRLAISLQPRYYFPHSWYAIALARVQQRDSALAEAREAVRLAPDNMLVRVFLGQTYALIGQRDSAYATARAVEALQPATPVPNVMIGRLYGIIGDKDRAVAAIRRGIDVNEAQAGQLLIPGFDTLFGDPRFEAMLREVHLR
jgi:eukaryotic-like serine/threonine-protein kinase